METDGNSLETNGNLLETKQLTYNEALKDFLKYYHLQFASSEALENLRKAYEREKIQLTALNSTLHVTVNQQAITAKNLQGSLVKAQNIISDNVQTILRLQECTNQKWLQEQEE